MGEEQGLSPANRALVVRTVGCVGVHSAFMEWSDLNTLLDAARSEGGCTTRPDQPRLRWFGTAAQVAGVFLVSGRLLEPWHGFAVMLVGSVAWSVAALRAREWSILALNLAFTGSNLLGIWKWLAP